MIVREMRGFADVGYILSVVPQMPIGHSAGSKVYERGQLNIDRSPGSLYILLTQIVWRVG